MAIHDERDWATGPDERIENNEYNEKKYKEVLKSKK